MIPRVPGVSQSSLSSPSLRAYASGAARRVNHGGAAWLKRRADELRQPQDGALTQDDSTSEDHKRIEAEDAQITGSTRSLGSRLMGLNVAARASAVLPAQAAIRQLLPRRPLFPRTTLLKA